MTSAVISFVVALEHRVGLRLREPAGRDRRGEVVLRRVRKRRDRPAAVLPFATASWASVLPPLRSAWSSASGMPRYVAEVFRISPASSPPPPPNAWPGPCVPAHPRTAEDDAPPKPPNPGRRSRGSRRRRRRSPRKCVNVPKPPAPCAARGRTSLARGRGLRAPRRYRAPRRPRRHPRRTSPASSCAASPPPFSRTALRIEVGR